MPPRSGRILVVAGVALLVAAGAGGLLLRRSAERRIRAAASPESSALRRETPLSFRPFARPSSGGVELLGDGSVAAVAISGGDLFTAGGSGLSSGERTLDPRDGLPSLRLSAVAPWRTGVAFAFAAGGWGRLGESGPEEALSPASLEVRALAETAAGELLVGARQGLYRAAWGAGTLERLDGAPVRSIALLPSGAIAAAGESGLKILSASGATIGAAAPGPGWVDDVGFDGRSLWVATPSGSFRSPGGDAPFVAHTLGGDGTRGTAAAGRWWVLPTTGRAVASLAEDGARREERTPERFFALFTAGADLLGDGPSGLWRRDPRGEWTLARPRPNPSLPAPHVNALAADGERLWLGFFDGGLATASREGGDGKRLVIGPVASDAWGVNALLPSGGVLWAATLRGTFRVERGRVAPVSPALVPAGGSYSLAPTRDGVTVGTASGVALPGPFLLSAFHGLPGNQATALLASPEGALWVGTPGGLGRVERRRVTAAAHRGEGKLPHPWVTALAADGDALLVGTYGEGVVRRTGDGSSERWERLAETAGLKVNAGALLVEPSGRAWLGTQGSGLWMAPARGAPFARSPLPLPSRNVFSLAVPPAKTPGALAVGTDEGLALLPLPPAGTPENR